MAIKWMSNTNYDTLFEIDIDIESDGQTIISWEGTPYVMGIKMLDVYVTGLKAYEDMYTETSTNSITWNDSTLLRGNVVTIRYIPSKISLGDIRVFTTYTDLSNSSNPYYNEVALVTSSRKFYRYGELGWEEFIIPFSNQNIGMVFLEEAQDIESYTTKTYTLQEIAYSPDTHSILVFIDGEKVENDKYTEVDYRTITFHDNLPEGSQKIEFLVANTDLWEDSNNHQGYYTHVNGSISTETIKVGTNTVKSTIFEYNDNGDIITEIITKGSKTITKTYVYTDGNISSFDVEIN